MRAKGLMGVVLAMFAGYAGAADWSVGPRITLNAVWDDNRRLTPIQGEEIEVYGAEIIALAEIQAETPVSTFYLTPRVRTTFYPDEPDLETTNWFADMGFERRGQRARGGFDLSYSNQETIGSYFPDADGGGGLGEPDPGVGIGNSPVTNTEERLRIRPTARFDLSERWLLNLDLGFLDVQYDQQEANERQDFQSTFARAALGYELTPTQTVALRGCRSLLLAHDCRLSWLPQQGGNGCNCNYLLQYRPHRSTCAQPQYAMPRRNAR